MKSNRIQMRRTVEAAPAASTGWRAPSVARARKNALLLVLLLFLAGVAGAGADAQSVNQAALIVMHGDGRVVTHCVDFTEAQISGFDLLQRSGLDLNIEASSMGATICRLDGEGCTFPQQSCFCQCDGGDSCAYWGYWQLENDAWRYSQLGVSNSTVLPGAINAWVWGNGAVGSAPQPPIRTFAEVCAPPATATETPTLTSTPPSPSPPTATGAPTETPTETPIAAPPTTLIAPPTVTPLPPARLPPTATMLPTSTPAPAMTLVMDMATPTPFQAPAPVIESFTADRREIMVGETVTLAWRIRNAASAYLQASGQQVTVALEGNLLLAPPQNTTYQLIASGAGGSASAGMTIIVRPRPPGSTIRADSLPSTLPSLPVESIVSPAATPPLPQLAATLSPLPPQVVAAAPLQPPTVSPVPTLAPVVLAGVATAPTVAGAPSTVSVVVGQESGATTFILLIGALALMGVPLLGLSLLLVFWALRSVRR